MDIARKFTEAYTNICLSKPSSDYSLLPNKLFLWFGVLPFTRRLNTDEFVGIMVGSFYCCRCVLPPVVRDRYPADPHEAVTRKSRCLTEDFRSATDMFAQIIFREWRSRYARGGFPANYNLPNYVLLGSLLACFLSFFLCTSKEGTYNTPWCITPSGLKRQRKLWR